MSGPDLEEMSQLIEAFRELDSQQQAYILAAVRWLADDKSGRLTKLLQQHQRGERVCDQYFDMASRQVRTLPPGVPVPDRWEPVLGPLEMPASA